MYKNRAPDGRCNLCGQRVAQLRKAMGPDVSQRALADMLQLAGMDVDKNAIQRIESGKRVCHRYRIEDPGSSIGRHCGGLAGMREIRLKQPGVTPR